MSRLEYKTNTREKQKIIQKNECPQYIRSSREKTLRIGNTEIPSIPFGEITIKYEHNNPVLIVESKKNKLDGKEIWEVTKTRIKN